jgi:hypothetical protein
MTEERLNLIATQLGRRVLLQAVSRHLAATLDTEVVSANLNITLRLTNGEHEALLETLRRVRAMTLGPDAEV